MKTNVTSLQVIRPDWSLSGVHACSTTRVGGSSQPPFDSLNLATHVEDEASVVANNRARLCSELNLPAEPVWLEQVHGNTVVDAASVKGLPQADAAYTTEKGVVCAVLTADCLPVLFAARDGRAVAAAHAGWRGLAGGVLEATVDRLVNDCACQPADIFAWMGPAIGPTAFEVGEEVLTAFSRIDSCLEVAFTAGRPGHWLADIYSLARTLLKRCGVTEVSGGGRCTYTEEALFYSYRRAPRTGRMASMISLS